MSWVSKRATSRVEDMAYCMLGLFSVNMPLLYGEGKKAFIRLQLEIIRRTDDESFFAWTSQPVSSGMLASQPSYFANSGDIVTHHKHLRERRPPYQMANQGLAFEVSCHAPVRDCEVEGPALSKGRILLLTLNCWTV